MKIALFGATGHIGQGILDEALSRGYDVVAIVRDPARLPQKNAKLKVVTGDVANASTWLDAVHGTDDAVASLSARRDGNPDSVPANAGVLLDNLPKANVKRLLWVGGAGTLEVAPGKRVIDDPHFPPSGSRKPKPKARHWKCSAPASPQWNGPTSAPPP